MTGTELGAKFKIATLPHVNSLDLMTRSLKGDLESPKAEQRAANRMSTDEGAAEGAAMTPTAEETTAGATGTNVGGVGGSTESNADKGGGKKPTKRSHDTNNITAEHGTNSMPRTINWRARRKLCACALVKCA